MLFCTFGLAILESLGYALFAFAVQSIPDSKIVYFIWRIFDFVFFQTFLLGMLCFTSGIMNRLFQLNLSFYKMIFISVAFAVIFYIFIVLLLIDDGIILKTIG